MAKISNDFNSSKNSHWIAYVYTHKSKKKLERLTNTNILYNILCFTPSFRMSNAEPSSAPVLDPVKILQVPVKLMRQVVFFNLRFNVQ